ncbi:MAG: hypothetical protein IPK75_18835 [Acidobacteria bacterium]|nr:hypothetical protein [Acidobacteriota bacterium]
MTIDNFSLDKAMKAALWEEAKGKLRALAAVQGCYSARLQKHTEERWFALNSAIDEFIASVEDRALHE